MLVSAAMEWARPRPSARCADAFGGDPGAAALPRGVEADSNDVTCRGIHALGAIFRYNNTAAMTAMQDSSNPAGKQKCRVAAPYLGGQWAVLNVPQVRGHDDVDAKVGAVPLQHRYTQAVREQLRDREQELQHLWRPDVHLRLRLLAQQHLVHGRLKVRHKAGARPDQRSQGCGRRGARFAVAASRRGAGPLLNIPAAWACDERHRNDMRGA